MGEYGAERRCSLQRPQSLSATRLASSAAIVEVRHCRGGGKLRAMSAAEENGGLEQRYGAALLALTVTVSQKSSRVSGSLLAGECGTLYIGSEAQALAACLTMCSGHFVSDGRWALFNESPAARTIVTWLILPAIICLSQRLSHACLSINHFIR